MGEVTKKCQHLNTIVHQDPPRKNQKAGDYWIDSELCIDCGAMTEPKSYTLVVDFNNPNQLNKKR